jgi:hypothetical protein
LGFVVFMALPGGGTGLPNGADEHRGGAAGSVKPATFFSSKYRSDTVDYREYEERSLIFKSVTAS